VIFRSGSPTAVPDPYVIRAIKMMIGIGMPSNHNKIERIAVSLVNV